MLGQDVHTLDEAEHWLKYYQLKYPAGKPYPNGKGFYPDSKFKIVSIRFGNHLMLNDTPPFKSIAQNKEIVKIELAEDRTKVNTAFIADIAAHNRNVEYHLFAGDLTRDEARELTLPY